VVGMLFPVELLKFLASAIGREVVPFTEKEKIKGDGVSGLLLAKFSLSPN
jgi:hypothetical protein